MRSALSFLGLGFLFVALFGVWLYAGAEEVFFESQESKTNFGSPVFNKIQWFTQKDQDIWMMQQSHHGPDSPSWDRLAIVIDKSQTPYQATFYQLQPGVLNPQALKPLPLKAACFRCHANGPRVIRPNLKSKSATLPWIERLRIHLWNLRIKSYGKVVATNASTDFKNLDEFSTEPLSIRTCTLCHKEEGLFARGTLQRQHRDTIRFMVSTGNMPPLGFSLKPHEKVQLQKFIGNR